ncbi:MAG: hypothetical protein RSB20_04105, partial [Clostridia bacterium]
MKIDQLIKILKAKIVNVPSSLENELEGGYCGDFLSFVMSRAPASCVWFTVMTNLNVAAVASLASVGCVVICEDYGVCSTQERMMLMSMDKNISNFDVVESNILRKGVAKKIGDKFEEAHKLFYKKGEQCRTSKKLLDYIWDVQIAMQKGYGFSVIHSVEYTWILVQQLNLIKYYPSIYWNTAVLLVESGALELEEVENSDIHSK